MVLTLVQSLQLSAWAASWQQQPAAQKIVGTMFTLHKLPFALARNSQFTPNNNLRPCKMPLEGFCYSITSKTSDEVLSGAYGSVDATATTSSLLQQNPEWFILLVPTHPGSPRQRVIKWL